ncbi:lipase family protein [Morganella psychrotolerans]|uniref:Lipase n=1 Tax=Morganella psychrotolerans TaxID=368603 RepID=A0A1B8HJP8_9GAMM|nr:lipase family protein [Morganella psychrotolerans]OBU09380.1 lipase [Morganella psychrotolerans]
MPYHDGYCVDCNKRKVWIEIVLVDELNQPVAGMPYTLKIYNGEKRTGVTDVNGFIREENLPPTGGGFSVDAQSLADEMEKRPLRTNRHSLASRAMYDARQRSDLYRYVTIGRLCDSIPKIENWEEPEPPAYHFQSKNPKGIFVNFDNRRLVFEICPFRAWSFLLHHQKEYSIVNACNLSILSVLAYASLKANDAEKPNESNYQGSIEEVFLNQFFDLSKIPTKFEGNNFTPVVYDVPFSERYTVIEFIDSDKDLDSQMFFIANKKEMVISWRGTAGMSDIKTDATFKPVKLDSDMGVSGYVHSGFYQAFKVINKKYLLRKKHGKQSDQNILEYMISLCKDRKLFIAGHSLGGCLALLTAIKMRKNKPVLYTIGMPRVLTLSVGKQLDDIIHHRHVNQDDVVPGLPFEQNMNNGLFANDHDFAGYSYEIMFIMMRLNPQIIISRKLMLSLKNKDDIYIHHGNPTHFYEKTIVRYTYNFYENGIPNNVTEKLYLVSELLPDNQHKKKYFELYRIPRNSATNPFGALDHSSVKYTDFIIKRLTFLLKNNKISDSAYEIRMEFERQKANYRSTYNENQYLFDLDLMISDTLLPTLLTPEGITALKRYKNETKNN